MLNGISPHCNVSLGFQKEVNRTGNPAGITGSDPVLVRQLELGKLGKCGGCRAAREAKGVQTASLDEDLVGMLGFMFREVKGAKQYADTGRQIQT